MLRTATKTHSEKSARDRDAGVQGRRGPAGARLTSLAAAFAEPLLRGRFGRPYFYLERCESTQRMLDAVYEDLGARDFLRGRRVTVDGVAGTSRLITRDGRLEVSTASGPLLVESGEVLFDR